MQLQRISRKPQNVSSIFLVTFNKSSIQAESKLQRMVSFIGSFGFAIRQCYHTIQGRMSVGCLTCTMDPLYTSGLHDQSHACEYMFLQTSHAKPPLLIRVHNVQYPLEMLLHRPGRYGYYCTFLQSSKQTATISKSFNMFFLLHNPTPCQLLQVKQVPPSLM